MVLRNCRPLGGSPNAAGRIARRCRAAICHAPTSRRFVHRRAAALALPADHSRSDGWRAPTARASSRSSARRAPWRISASTTAPASPQPKSTISRATNGRMTAEDILWRRSKLGLHMSRGRAAALRSCVPLKHEVERLRLSGISYRAGSELWLQDIDLSTRRGRHQRAARRDARRQDDAAADHGRTRSTDDAGESSMATAISPACRCDSATSRWSISSSSTIRRSPSSKTSPRRCASRARAKPRSRRA